MQLQERTAGFHASFSFLPALPLVGQCSCLTPWPLGGSEHSYGVLATSMLQGMLQDPSLWRPTTLGAPEAC